MTVRKTLVDLRFCERCGWIIARRSTDGPAAYKKRRYCSHKCAMVTIGGGNRKFTDNYFTLHWRVREARGPASGYACEHCKTQAHDWAQLHDRDGQDPFDFMPLCRKCHITYDGNLYKAAVSRRASGKSGWTQERRQAASEQMRKTMTEYYGRKKEQ